MEYKAFALKYRPKNFDEVIGQERVVITLKTAILKKHVHHAYIFSGPRGVGKTSLARIFAKSLNCFEGPTVKPCGKCTSCLEIAKGTPLDVIEIDGASNRGIEEIRVLRENVKLSPTYSRYKIYIIDEVHMLSQDAFNALLKTLEEPPPHVKFIFATTHPQKVLPTILSRCQRAQFSLLPLEKIVEKLKVIIAQEGLKIEDSLLYSVSRAADGSIRDAESLLDQLVPVILEKGSIDDVFSFLGIIDEESLNMFMQYIVGKDLVASLDLIDKLVNSGKDLGVFVDALIEYLRNLLLSKVSPKAFKELSDVSPRSKDIILKISASISVAEVLKILDSLIEAKELSRKLNTIRIPLELVLVKLLYDFSKDPAPLKTAIMAKKVEDAKKSEIKTEVSVLQKMRQEVDAQLKNLDTNDDPIDIDEGISPDAQADDNALLVEIKNRWQEIVYDMQKKRAAIASHISLAQPYATCGSLIKIAFDRKDCFHKEIVESNKNVKFVEEVISKVINKQIGVKFILAEGVQSPLQNGFRAQAQAKANGSENLQAPGKTESKGSDISADNDFMNDLLDTFGGSYHTDNE
ncbi:MAG: DNA polymerase III subunit gamma/tau [Candidatus Omnitrophica bacterium]|nr:DNA polymerase III subunit gamma/tau [Candidatus Omnitrophota bacterium]